MKKGVDSKIRKLRETTEALPCQLTNDELLAYGNDLGATIQDIAAEEDRQASIKVEMKSRMTKLEAIRTELASKITRREEYRDVKVEVILDFGDDKYKKVRLDTGEVIFERPINDEERQESLI
jgi:hypothetical protein